MQTLTAGSPASRLPGWLQVSAVFGILWNAFGVYQFTNSFTEAGRAAMSAGMNAAQAQAYLSLPAWVSLAFALGVFAGLVGTMALALQRRIAVPALLLSLIAYGLLFTGDAAHGVFDGAPGQLITLVFVLLIAAGMLWAAWFARRQGLLR